MPPIPELEAIRKSQILDAALKVLASTGSAKVTMAEIASSAGLSKGGLIHYFQSKDELFQATFKEFFQRIFVRSMETLATLEDPLEQVLSFVWLYNREDPDFHIGYPLFFECMALAVHEPAYRRLFHEWVDNWIRLLGDSLEKAKDQGLLAPELESEPVARGISAIYQGIAARWYLDPDPHSSNWARETLRSAVLGLLAPYRCGTPVTLNPYPEEEA